MIELTLPSFGADMDDAEFVQWKVQPGQSVRKGDIVCVVETQKGAIDVEVWQPGTVARLLAEPGHRRSLRSRPVPNIRCGWRVSRWRRFRARRATA